MGEFYINLVIDAFNRCYGLQDALKNGVDKEDSLLIKGAIDSLSYQTGLRRDFIQKHIDEIIEL